MKKIITVLMTTVVIGASCITALATEAGQGTEEMVQPQTEEQAADNGSINEGDISLDEMSSDELMEYFNSYNGKIAEASEKESALKEQVEEQYTITEEFEEQLEAVTEDYNEYIDGLDEAIKEYKAELTKACLLFPFYKISEYGGPINRIKLRINWEDHFDAITEKYEEGYDAAYDNASTEEEKLEELQDKLAEQTEYIDNLKEEQKEVEGKYYETKEEEEKAEKAAQEAAAKATEEKAQQKAEEEATQSAAEETTVVSGEVRSNAQTAQTESTQIEDLYTDENNFTGENAPVEEATSDSYEMPNDPNALTYSKGLNYFNGHTETWYTRRVWKGDLGIPGMYIGKDGIIRDCDNYICVASDDYPKGTVIETSLGMGKVYDSGSGHNNIDIYTDWPV